MIMTAWMLTGCAYQWSQFEASVAALDGESLRQVSSQLGYPTGRRHVEGMDLIYWDAAGITDEMLTAGGDAARQRARSAKRMCRITFRITSADTLHDPEIQGNRKTCRGYIRSLKASEPERKS